MTKGDEWKLSQRTVSIDVGPDGVRRLRDVFLRLKEKGGEYKRITRPSFLKGLLGIEERIHLTDEEEGYLSGRLDILPELPDTRASEGAAGLHSKKRKIL